MCRRFAKTDRQTDREWMRKWYIWSGGSLSKYKSHQWMTNPVWVNQSSMWEWPIMAIEVLSKFAWWPEIGRLPVCGAVSSAFPIWDLFYTATNFRNFLISVVYLAVYFCSWLVEKLVFATPEEKTLILSLGISTSTFYLLVLYRYKLLLDNLEFYN